MRPSAPTPGADLPGGAAWILSLAGLGLAAAAGLSWDSASTAPDPAPLAPPTQLAAPAPTPIAPAVVERVAVKAAPTEAAPTEAAPAEAAPLEAEEMEIDEAEIETAQEAAEIEAAEVEPPEVEAPKLAAAPIAAPAPAPSDVGAASEGFNVADDHACRLLRLRYEPNQELLTPAQLGQLRQAARWLQRRGGQPITIRGFSDADGGPYYNLRLSQRRGRVVSRQLIAAGQPAAQITLQSFGSFVPLSGLAPEDGRNRRVELWLPGGRCPTDLFAEEAQ